jgi:hypothetical protein
MISNVFSISCLSSGPMAAIGSLELSMSDLNQHIDNAARYQAAPNPDMPINDQSGNASLPSASPSATLPLNAAAAPAPEPVRSLGAMPIPN